MKNRIVQAIGNHDDLMTTDRRACQDTSAGHCVRKVKERQTEEKMGK